jgi:hypothetical protein
MSAIAVFILASSVVLAQTASWTIRDDPSGQGTVYRSEVIGASSRDKNTRQARVALQFACGATMQPILMLQWEGMQGYGTRRVNYSVDRRISPGGASFTMHQENDILYRDLESSRELLQAMKSGSTITFDWVGLDQTRYLATFNLSTFRSNLSEFNRKCNTTL